MPKRTNSVFIGWICAAVIVAVALLATTSPTFQKCFASPVTTAQKAGEIAKPSPERSLIGDSWQVVQCEGDFLNANSVLLIAIATIVIAAFAWEANERQLRATTAMADAAQRAISVAERSLMVGHRAFVFFKEINSGRVVDSKTMTIKYWTITPMFQNTGDTPTKELSGRVNHDFFDGEPPADFTFPDIHRENDWSARIGAAHVLLAPKSAANIGGSILIGIERMIELAKRNENFFFWGWIDYNDIFAGTPRHRTEFCIQLIVEGDPSKVSAAGVSDCRISARYYHRHNAVDDECVQPPQPIGGTLNQGVAQRLA